MSPQVKEPQATAPQHRVPSLGRGGGALFITGSGGQRAEVTNDANESLTDPSPSRSDGSPGTWAEKTMKARCLSMEWQMPRAAKNLRVEEGELLLRKGTLILSENSTLDLALWAVEPQSFLVFLGGEGTAQLFLGTW